MTGNTAVLRALFVELDALGVREFCVCAGARDAPIIQALVQRNAMIRHFFDERSAAFFALGRVMKTRAPVAVLTTSGTAAAELLPAIIEAHYQNLPLIAITADRPSRYRGSGAPQAIEQENLFGDYTARKVEMEWSADGGLVRRASSRRGRTVHFNVCLEEGLSIDDPETLFDAASLAPGSGFPDSQDGDTPDRESLEAWCDFFDAEGPIIVLAGGIHPADCVGATDFLRELSAPVAAEATSNLWGDPRLASMLVRGGEKALAEINASRVVRLGGVPSWRWWRDLEMRPEVRVLNVTHSSFPGLARTQNVATVSWVPLVGGCPNGARLPSGASVGGGSHAERLDTLLVSFSNSEPSWMRQLSRMAGENSVVFLGNSLPIREWNLAADDPKRGTEFFANRGANGIDGLVSTWLGVSAEAGEAWLVVGDLSAMYDMNAPWILSQLAVAKRRIVVINNGGGKIFSQVSWLSLMSPEAKRVMENPHVFSFEPWARMWGMDYRLFTDSSGLHDDDASCCVWEIRPDPVQTAAFWQSWRN